MDTDRENVQQFFDTYHLVVLEKKVKICDYYSSKKCEPQN